MKKLILGLLMFFAASCHNSNNTKDLSLKINVIEEPPTMDPRKGAEPIGSMMHFLLFDGLTRLNPDDSVTPAQAERIEISEDKKTYTFYLKSTFWSDGSPVTAYDFEKSWKDILKVDFPAPNAHLLYPIKNAEAAKKGKVTPDEIGIHSPDAKTLVVELEKPTPYFLQLIAFCVFFPVNHEIDQAHPNWAFEAGPHFITNGPYVLKSWKHSDAITLEKNPRYWDQEAVKLDGIQISMVKNELTALQMFENGELDLIGGSISPIPVDSLEDLSKKGLLVNKPIAGTTICTFNTTRFPFNNAKIRKAFSLAINRNTIVQNVTKLDEEPATGMIPPVLKNNKKKSFFQSSDAQAKALFEEGLKELGKEPSDLKELTYIYSTKDVDHKVAQALQQQWATVLGVNVKLENMEQKILFDRLGKRDYLFAQTMWISQYNDQMNIFERFKFKGNAKNYPSWENQSYASLLDRSAMDTTPEERAVTLEEAEALFIEEMPLAPIFHFNNAYLVQKSVKNFAISPIGVIYFTHLEKQ